MKLTYDNSKSFAFRFMRSIGRAIDDPDVWVELYYNGVSIGCIQPQTKDYWTRRDILRQYRWENYPEGYFEECVMWIGDVCIRFNEFKERGL